MSSESEHGQAMSEIRLVPLRGWPLVGEGDDLAALVLASAERQGIALRRGFVVIAQKVVSKSEGRVVDLATVTPSAEANAIAEEFAEFDKDPRQVQVVLDETRRVVRKGHGVLICETRHGFVCANAGVDLSNAPGEDLADYPRDLDRDSQRCREAGVDVLLAPPVHEMYPEPVLTEVSVGALSMVLDGISRPTHFQGVATVVAKLFNIAGPCSGFFGEKDWQQLQVIRRITRDLNLGVEVVPVPIEMSGISMSGISNRGSSRLVRSRPVRSRSVTSKFLMSFQLIMVLLSVGPFGDGP